MYIPPNLIVQQTLSGRIHPPGSVCLRHLGETLTQPLFQADEILLTYFAHWFFLLMFELEISNA